MQPSFSSLKEGQKTLKLKESVKISVFDEISELSSFYKQPPDTEELSQNRKEKKSFYQRLMKMNLKNEIKEKSPKKTLRITDFFKSKKNSNQNNNYYLDESLTQNSQKNSRGSLNQFEGFDATQFSVEANESTFDGYNASLHGIDQQSISYYRNCKLTQKKDNKFKKIDITAKTIYSQTQEVKIEENEKQDSLSESSLQGNQ